MAKIWNNLSGTTASSFSIGKNGVTLYQGTTAPDNGDGTNGDVYLRTGSSAGIYQKISGSWAMVNDVFLRQSVNIGNSATISDATTYMAVVGSWTTGSTVLTLPSGTPGKQFVVKDESGVAASHNITISGGTIDGANSCVISNNYGSVTLSFNGSSWFAIRKA
jgi:hypothetical protein